MRIKIVGLDVNDRRVLVLKLSANPPEKWRTFFKERWVSPTNFSGTFRPAVLVGWEDPIGPLFKTTPEDFETTYKSVVIAAVNYANDEVKRSEAAQVTKARADVEKEESNREDLERERQKARAIKF